ncbi:MAG TPA: hypothetical protein DCF91_06685 [Porphyromonadaceae bacterium]|nr:hypothetical protein [Porphyromonadaceae bacterium]
MKLRKSFPFILVLCITLCQSLFANSEENDRLPPDEDLGLHPVSLAIGDVRLQNNCVEITLDEEAKDVFVSINHLDGVVTNEVIRSGRMAIIPLASDYKFTVILEKEGQDYIYVLPQ